MSKWLVYDCYRKGGHWYCVMQDGSVRGPLSSRIAAMMLKQRVGC